jgi:hypothetical protein
MKSASFEKFAGLCAIAAGIVGFLYALAFVVVSRSNPQLGGLLAALFLALGGLLSSVVFTGLFSRLQSTEPGFALWAVILGLFGAMGSLIHGGYDLANTINVPDSLPANLANLPSQVDPRGLLTFGVVGIALLVTAWLIARGGQLPRNLGYLGYLLGVLLIVIYLGRLIILDPTHPLLVAAVLPTGFIINPLWNIWLGLSLHRTQTAI